MKQSIKLIGIILLILNIYSCDIHWYDPDKPKPGCLNQMPEETSIGANTFGCYINEELAALQGFFQQEGIATNFWGAYTRYVNGFWGEYSKSLDGNNIYTCMNLQANGELYYMYIKIYDTIYLGDNDCSIILELRDPKTLYGYIDNTINIINFDTIEHIISGRFDDITVPIQFTDSIVYISKGQFDIKYGTNF